MGLVVSSRVWAMDETEREQIIRIREQIVAVEQALHQLTLWRAAKIVIMSRTMTQRQVAELWNISQPRVQQILRGWRSRSRPASG